MKSWLKEPLWQFSLFGVLLFVVYSWLEPADKQQSQQIINVDAADIAWLQKSWAQLHLAAPSESEMQGILADYIKEQVLAREAMEWGLADNDVIIRRRLAQKMDFLLQDTVRLVEPTEAQLTRFYQQHQQRYVLAAKISFEQRYFSDEQAALHELQQAQQQGKNPSGQGSLLPITVENADGKMIKNQFGQAFLQQLLPLPDNQWSKPVASEMGFHLLRVTARTTPQQLSYQQVQAQVKQDWQQDFIEQAAALNIQHLMDKYQVQLADNVNLTLPAQGLQ